ncbi:MAG: sulfite exporter TauE/SafE family protein [Victivallaceae bacterium]|nr:sulfite exporter TauE/SafE family protein [Victivallaceae bacterium]
MEYVIIMFIIILAGIIQGTSGFGFGLVALGLISLLINIKDASIMLAVAGFSINLILLWRLRKYYKTDRMLPVIVSAAIGAPFGVMFLLDCNVEIIRKLLGIILFITLLQRINPCLSGKRWDPFWLGIPAGFLGGALSGAFGTGGPPVVAYTASQDFEKHRYVACVQAVLGIGAISRIIFLSINGAFT